MFSSTWVTYRLVLQILTLRLSVNAWTLIIRFSEKDTKIWILQILLPSHNILNISKIIPFHICQQHVSTKSANDFCEKYTWDFFRFSHDNWWTPHQISAADSFEVVSHNYKMTICATKRRALKLCRDRKKSAKINWSLWCVVWLMDKTIR